MVRKEGLDPEVDLSMDQWERAIKGSLARDQALWSYEFFRQPFQCFDRLDSTMDQARRQRDPAQALFLVEDQRAGQGQGGKTWQSVAGKSLLATLKLALDQPAQDLVWLPLFMGLVIRRALAKKGLACQIKWPNDLYLAGKKVGGILCQADLVQGQVRALRIGWGLNVNEEGRDLALPQAGSLAAYAGRTFSRWQILRDILVEFARAWPRFCQGDLAWLVQEVNQHLYQGQLALGAGRAGCYVNGQGVLLTRTKKEGGRKP